MQSSRPGFAPKPLKKVQLTPQRTAKATGGRPLKYGEPSRPITVTLPESVLQGLEQIHHDRGQAIVKLTAAALNSARTSPPQVEIVEMAERTGLLVVGRCEALMRIPFLHLVEVAPDRFLLALDPGNDFRTLEIAVQDMLDDLPNDANPERELLMQLLAHIRQMRKSARVSMAEILFVSLNGEQKDEPLRKQGEPVPARASTVVRPSRSPAKR
jgi:hypothetical protein